MTRFIQVLLLCGVVSAISLRAETAAPSAADRDWAAYEAATKVEPATPFADLSIVDKMKFYEEHALRLGELGLDFIEKHPTDPRRWIIVSRFFPQMPRFVKEYGPLDDKGYPELVIDKAAAAAWSAKVAELKAAMARATDVPAEIADAAAKAAKDREERPAMIRAFFAKWRSGREMAPEFPMQDLAGREVKLADFRGKVLVLDFWSSWCMPCIEAMPHNQAVAARYKDQGVVVLACCTNDSRRSFETWVRKHQTELPDLIWSHDPVGKSEQRVSKSLYGVPAIPTQFIIDRDGRVVEVVYGYMKGEVLLDAALAKAGIRVDVALLDQAEADRKQRTKMGLEY